MVRPNPSPDTLRPNPGPSPVTLALARALALTQVPALALAFPLNPTLPQPHLPPTLTLTRSASSDNSMRLHMSNGSTVQFDGFWERDSCAA